MNPIQSPAITFTFRSYSFDRTTGDAQFVYAIDEQEFVERVKFPLPAVLPEGIDVALDRALFALHLIGGVSYYKAKLPPKIVVASGKLTKDEAVFWDKLYTMGLGEFFFKNDLDFCDYIHFPAEIEARVVGETAGEGALLPIGGGKDSLVAIEMLREGGKAFDLVMLGKHARIREVAAEVGKSLMVIERELDAKLFELNKQGAWNGHVPITAYVSLASAIVAILHGKRDVVFANERSANIPNVVVDGVSINHQYSKSIEVERELQAYIHASVSRNVNVFSLLRPFSELDIARRFAANGKYFMIFSSCNRNYSQSGAPTVTRWCGKCPKCAFVFIILAAFIPRRKMVEIFGEDLLLKSELLPLYQDLLGCGVMKPFECVADADEVIAAFALVEGRGEYDDSPIMQWFVENVLANRKDLDALIKQELTPSDEHAMPEEYSAIAYASR